MSPRVVVAGEALIDFLPDREGPLADVETFTRSPGGAPANVAVRLADLGEPPWFWTRVGADAFGEYLVRTLARRGVPDRFVERDPDAGTGLAFVARAADGDAEFSFHRDGTADTRLRPGAVPDDVLAEVDWVYFGGVCLADEPSRTAVLDLARRAAARGCAVAFDPNARPALWAGGEFEAAVAAALDVADLVVATPDDLRAAGIDGATPDALARSVCDRGVATAMVTLGDAGAYARATVDAPWGPATVSHPGYAVDAVDTAGAGDAFAAGALAALTGGEGSLAAVVRFANAVAALTTTRPGALGRLVDRAAVRALQASREESVD